MQIKVLIMLIFGFSSISILSGQGLFESELKAGGRNLLIDPSIHGSVEAVCYVGINASNDPIYVQAMYSNFNLSADIATYKFGHAYADLRFRYGKEFQESLPIAEIREAYAELYLGPISIVAGKKITGWGTTTFINPSDRFSPLNPVYRSPEPDELKIGRWLVNSRINIGDLSSITLNWFPDYQPSVLLTDPFVVPSYIDILPYNSRSDPVKSGFSIIFDNRNSLLDFQLSYFNGYRNTPSLLSDSISFDQSTMYPELIRIKQEPVRIHHGGINLSIPIGNWIIRSEWGYLQTAENEYTGTPLKELSVTSEIEHSMDLFTLILGYYGKFIPEAMNYKVSTSLLEGSLPSAEEFFPKGGITSEPDLIASYVNEQVAGMNRLYEYQQFRFYHSVYTATEIKLFREKIILTIPGMYNFTAGELTLLPSIKYTLTDGLAFRVGVYYLNGKNGSIYNLIDDALNAVYFSLNVNF